MTIKKASIHKSLIWSLILSSLILFSQPSFALAKFGHQVVCQLAFDHLPLAKQQRVTQYLNAVPRKQQSIINQYTGQSKDAKLTFANACTWADAIKNHAQFKQYKTWHYLNVPRDLVRINKPLCSKNCIPQAIIKHQRQLQNDPRSWQSAQALMFLGHWLADIHQPLHVSYADDLGGNKVRLVNTKSACKNLHSYWDSCLIKTSHRSKQQWVDLLSSQWNSFRVTAFYNQQVWSWADESYQIVREPDFKYCQLKQKGDGYFTCQKSAREIQLTKQYPQHYLPVIEKQLLKAAKRLAIILEQSL